MTNPDYELHSDILAEVHELYKKKNADYGSSFAYQYKEYGMTSAVIRLDDKIRRLKQLLKSEAQVDESKEDTLMDIIGYAALTLMEMRKEKDEQAS